MQFGLLTELLKDMTVPEPIRQALIFLQTHDILEMVPGRHEIAGEDLYVNVFDTVTLPYGQQRAESHERYYDVQYLACGAERLYYAAAGTAAVVDERIAERDVLFYEGTPDAEYIDVSAGTVTIFAPGEIHRPAVAADVPHEIRKAVVKVCAALILS